MKIGKNYEAWETVCSVTERHNKTCQMWNLEILNDSDYRLCWAAAILNIIAYFDNYFTNHSAFIILLHQIRFRV